MSLKNFVLGFVVGAIPTTIVGSIILLVLSLRPTILPPLYVDESKKRNLTKPGFTRLGDSESLWI